MTVALLVQIDKLVMLIESPVFTCERASLTTIVVSSLTFAFSSFEIAALRTGEIPVLVQVPVRLAHVTATKQCIRIPQKSVECCELDGLSSYCS